MVMKKIQHREVTWVDTAKIEVLLRAIELGSLSKAAEEYLYTPSALSHMVDAIEKEIGAKIINRTHMGIEVTNEKIVEKLKEICNLQNEIFKLADKTDTAKTITIATYASLAKNILPEITKTFRKKYEDVHINIIVVDKMSEIMSNSGADIYFGEKFSGFSGEWKEIETDNYIAIFPKDDNEISFSPEKKYNRTFIAPNDQKTLAFVDKNNFDDVLEVSSHDDSLIIELVAKREGISVLPKLSVKNYENRVKVVPLTKPLFRTIGVMYDKNSKNINLIKKFLKYFD